MPKSNVDDWDEVRDAFEGGASINNLSRLYGVSRAAIHKRASKGGWSVTGMTAAEAEDHIQARAHARAMGVDPDADRDTQEAQVNRAADDRSDLIRRHREMWDVAVPLHLRIKKAFDPDWAPAGIDPSTFDEARRVSYASQVTSIYQKTVQSILIHQEGERRAHGFDYRIQQKNIDGADDQTKRREELLGQLREHLRNLPKTIEGEVVEEE